MSFTFLEFTKELPPWIVLVFGVVAGSLRAVWSALYEHTIGYAISRLCISLTVEDSESRDAYVWLSCWVERNLRGRRVNSLLLRVRAGEDAADRRGGFDMIPEYGSYYLWYRRRVMTVEHRRDAPADGLRGRSTHSIRVQIWLSRDRALLLAILDEARTSYGDARSRRIEAFRADTYGDWTGSPIAARPLASVFHPPELMNDLLEDVGHFLRSRELYEELGIPYRRGYLLAGPPGTGKSSLILAVASHFDLPVYLVPLRGAEMTGERLASMLAGCRRPSLVALEDADCLRVATSRSSKTTDGLTMADLLNVVDGIGASEDRVLFITANHPESLDAALTRAGRVDRKFFVGYARDEELFRFHQRLARSREVAPWAEFRAALPDQATIADAQALALQGNAAAHRQN